MPEGLASCWGMVNDESKQTQVGLSCRLPRHTMRKAEVILDRCIDSVPFYAYPAPLVAKAEAPERLGAAANVSVRGSGESPHQAASP